MIVEGLYYTEESEWVRVDGDVVVVGITHYAQDMLGEITFVELPAVGTELEVGNDMAVVESSKAASDVFCPVDGNVVEVNDELESNPELINEDCYGKGWLCKLEINDNMNIENLMNAEQYKEFLKKL